MALCWKWSRPVFLFLLALYDVTAQEPTTPAPTVSTRNTLPGNHTDDNSTHARTTTPAQTAKPTVSRSTTINMESIMSERDYFQSESDRLRVAVIILGIFFALAALFIIIVGIYVFLKRRNSGTLKSDSRAQQATSTQQKNAARLQNLPKPQNKNKTADQIAKNKTNKLVQLQEKEVANRHSTSPSTTSGDYEEQSSSPDKTLPKRPPVAPETKKEFYANTKALPGQSIESVDLDEREVYIELDEDKTTTNESGASKPQVPIRPDQRIPSEDIYENYSPKGGETYSELDTETQYDHHYD
ncbi:hypothetical protein BsWGS_25335 [Bradybaena similaris]